MNIKNKVRKMLGVVSASAMIMMMSSVVYAANDGLVDLALSEVIMSLPDTKGWEEISSRMKRQGLSEAVMAERYLSAAGTRGGEHSKAQAEFIYREVGENIKLRDEITAILREASRGEDSQGEPLYSFKEHWDRLFPQTENASRTANGELDDRKKKILELCIEADKVDADGESSEFKKFCSAIEGFSANIGTVIGHAQMPEELIRRPKKGSILDVAAGIPFDRYKTNSNSIPNAFSNLILFADSNQFEVEIKPTRETLKQAIAVGNKDLFNKIFERLLKLEKLTGSDGRIENSYDLMTVAADYHRLEMLGWLFKNARPVEQKAFVKYATEKHQACSLLVVAAESLGINRERFAASIMRDYVLPRTEWIDTLPSSTKIMDVKTLSSNLKIEEEISGFVDLALAVRNANVCVVRVDNDNNYRFYNPWSFCARELASMWEGAGIGIDSNFDNNNPADELGWYENSSGEIVGLPLPEDGKFSSCYKVGDVEVNIYKHSGSGIRHIVLPDGCTSIEAGTFRGRLGLKSVAIPGTVKSIGDGAFYVCSGLTSVKLPKDLTSIEARTFEYCSGLKSVVIPDNVESIGANAFHGCSGLTSVGLPENLKSIGEDAFICCNGLTSIAIPASVTSIGDGAFYGSGLTSVKLPENLKSIGKEAFKDCLELESITIPANIKNIAKDTFMGCPAMKKIELIGDDDSELSNELVAALGSCIGPLEGCIEPKVSIVSQIKGLIGKEKLIKVREKESVNHVST